MKLSHTVSVENGLAYINQLDLSYIEIRLVERLKWSKIKARETVRKYKNFLRLLCKHPNLDLVPTQQIDEAWHHHILYTREYMKDTQHIIGHYLHHAPTVVVEDKAQQKVINERMRQAYIETAVLYELEFAEPYDKKFLINTWG